MSERRDFLQTVLAALTMPGAAAALAEAAELTPAQQTPNTPRPAPRQLLPPPFDGMDASFSLITVQPGAVSQPHKHSGFVLGYVLEGEYLFAINNETPRIVRAGETFYEPPGATHTSSGTGQPDQPCKFLAIVIGPQGAAVTIR